MDAINAGASTLAFIGIALQSAKAICDVLAAFKDAPDVVLELCRDVAALSNTLQRIKECPLDGSIAASHTSSFQQHVTICKQELCIIHDKIMSFSSPSKSLSSQYWKNLLVVLRGKRLRQARNRIRDTIVQLNLHLSLIQTEVLLATSSAISQNATVTGGILQRILHEITRLHIRLDRNNTAGAAQEVVSMTEKTALGSGGSDITEVCSDLEASILRLSRLAGHDEAALREEDAEQIIEDLRGLIQSARNQVSSDRGKSCAVRKALRYIEGLISTAHVVKLNSNGVFFYPLALIISRRVIGKSR
jgi:hypothetical protein